MCSSGARRYDTALKVLPLGERKHSARLSRHVAGAFSEQGSKTRESSLAEMLSGKMPALPDRNGHDRA
jgi:hypothetical protein